MLKSIPCLLAVCLLGCHAAPKAKPAHPESTFQTWFEIDQDEIHFVVFNTQDAPLKIQVLTSGTTSQILYLFDGHPPGMAFAPCMGSLHQKPRHIGHLEKFRHTLKALKIEPNEAVEYHVTLRIDDLVHSKSFRILGKDFATLEKKMPEAWENYYKQIKASTSVPSSPKKP